MIELMVSSLIAIIFVLAAGTGYLVNQKSYNANRDKLELQQQASHVMEMMERKIREAAQAEIPPYPNNNRITLYGLNGNVMTVFRLNVNGPEVKLFERTTLLARQDLIQLVFTPSIDGTSVQIDLALQDTNFNKVAIRGSAALRNHPKLRHLEPDF